MEDVPVNIAVRPMRVPLRGSLRVPGDKSISHRALLLASLADGESRIEGLLRSGDCLATRDCLRVLGVEIEDDADEAVLIRGTGLRGLQGAAAPIDCVRSGTTLRLLAGILCGQGFSSVLTGDPQLLRRPMRRIVEPLLAMGADITDENGHAPLRIVGRVLRGVTHELTVASAQVKSALLLAGLFADGATTVRQPGPARDHTERMLIAMGASVRMEDLAVTLHPPESLSPVSVCVPGDISSAAFPLVAALLIPDSEITLQCVGLNPTRIGLLDVLEQMGARIKIAARRLESGEPVGDLTICGSELVGTTISGSAVVRMIDEFPILAVAAALARGETIVRDAQELRVKETDRIGAIVSELRALGAEIEETEDGFVVQGPTTLRGGVVDSHRDHRLAMALTVAGLVAEDEVTVRQAEYAADSYPGFSEQLEALGGEQ
jgi:3-phosphoshikimate 1-carboxyvinyltransferase